MDPTLLAMIKAYLTELLKDVIPDKDIHLRIDIEIDINNPKKE